MGPEKASRWLRNHSNHILTTAVIVGLLYFGRHVLIPLALAIMVSLLLAPSVRALRRIGVGRASSVFIVVLTLAVSCLGAAVVLGTQILRIAESLPHYEETIHIKLRAVDDVAFGKVRRLTSEASGLIQFQDAAEAPRSSRESGRYVPGRASTDFQSTGAALQPVQFLGKLLSAVWGPLQGAGIVLLVVIFVLLEHESLRDRFIRIAGATDIRAMTLALDDAGERLSRYFVSQCSLNLIFGVAIWASLKILGVPQALLWGALAGVMRFVPYVGVATAALFATALAFAVDPGWSLAVGTLAVFVLLDIIAGQLLEPRLYGHATGLSPLSIVIAAIFWSSLWGPVGLLLSTPLTLCLLVAGRHMKALAALELLLGDVQSLTLPQRFYQRALVGDPHEIIISARAFLKVHSLAAYCDQVLLPALHLARLDDERGTIDRDHQLKIRRVIVDVVTALNNNGSRFRQRAHRGAVLTQVSAGQWLRQQREQASGKWQGPLGVPERSVVICLGLSPSPDDLAAELLVRLLRSENLDARHFATKDMDIGLPLGAHPDGVAIVCLVSAFPSPGLERAESISQKVYELFPRAQVVWVLCPGVSGASGASSTGVGGEPIAHSLVQAIEFCTSWRGTHSKRDLSATPIPTQMMWSADQAASSQIA